jgi:hypothetical protein
MNNPESSDFTIVLNRLNDEEDEMISSEEIKKRLGL